MDKDYDNFIKELKNMAQEGVKNDVDKMNDKEKLMLPIIAIFYQQKLAKFTIWLVIATEFLVVITALLIYFKG
jgi:hypothetical protein